MSDQIDIVNLDKKADQLKAQRKKQCQIFRQKKQNKLKRSKFISNTFGKKTKTLGQKYKNHFYLYSQSYYKQKNNDIYKNQNKNQNNDNKRTNNFNNERNRHQEQKIQLNQQYVTNENQVKPNLIVRGLDVSITNEKLKVTFAQYGPLDMCKFDRDNFGIIKPQGICLIKFMKQEDAEKCSEALNGQTLALDETKFKISCEIINNNENANHEVMKIRKSKISKRSKQLKIKNNKK